MESFWNLWFHIIYNVIFLMKKSRYKIILFCNKKKIKLLYQCRTKNKVYEHWHEFKTHEKPPFIKLRTGGKKRKEDLVYELALIFPMNRWVSKDMLYVRDSLGRNVEARLDDNKFRIKDIYPYWEEELIYDYESKKRIRYYDMINYVLSITEIAQIFTLNNKLFVQVDNNIRLFGNKNIDDTTRLFEIVRDDIIKRKKGNFIFVKDLTTHQRTQLYNLLETKGYKRTELFRHYSY